MYQAQVDAAEIAVAAAQSALDHAAQTAVLADAVTALQAIDLGDLSTQDAIDAAEAAIAALRAALEAATELSASEKSAAMTELAAAGRIVMAAQGRVDVEGQKMMLSDAVDALDAIDLTDLSTQAKINAAQAAITALDLALEAATDLTNAEKLDATVDVTVAKRAVASAQETLTANIGEQRMALTMAGEALAAIDLDDLDTQDKIDAADMAVDALKAALDGATHLSDADKAMYQTQLDTATETVRTAQTGMDRDERMMAQRTEISNAVAAARTAVAGVDDESTDSEVSAADSAIAALRAAIEGAEDLPEGDADVASAQGTLTTLEGQLGAAKTSRMAALDDKAEEDKKANAKLGKAMRAALAGPAGEATDNALANLDTTTHPTLSATGSTLTINAAQGAGSLADAAAHADVILKAGDSAGSLGGWAGTNYAHTNTGTKVMNAAVVYNNQDDPKTVTFAKAGYTVATETTGTARKGYVYLGAGPATVFQTGFVVTDVGGPAFGHSGTQTHTKANPREDAVYIRGTYDGAPGEYRCSGTDPCTSTNDGKGSPSALGGTWHFKPDAAAMVMQPDANYLYYGWWLSKDKDGMPTAASAFTGVMGSIEGDGTTVLMGNPATITGSATYAGHAAGKFALSNPLDGTGSAGHFTADATLTATFGGGTPAPTSPGISGTLDNFMANDESVPWSVSLNRATWDGTTAGAFASTAADNTNTTAEATVWSIDGNSSPESGAWNGQMYDELPGGTGDDPPGDGSNIPTSVTGTFYSEFSTIGRMVGAFGADKQ